MRITFFKKQPKLEQLMKNPTVLDEDVIEGVPVDYEIVDDIPVSHKLDHEVWEAVDAPDPYWEEYIDSIKTAIREREFSEVKEETQDGDIVTGKLLTKSGSEYDFGLSEDIGLVWLADEEGQEFETEDTQWRLAKEFLVKYLARRERDPHLIQASGNPSMRVHQAYLEHRFSRPRNAKVMKYIGLMQSKGFHAFFNMDPTSSFAFLVHEGVDIETPHDIDKTIKDMRSWDDSRPAVVVVWGGYNHCKTWAEGCHEASHMIFCSDEDSLTRLGVPILDKDWKPGDSPISLDRLVTASQEAPSLPEMSIPSQTNPQPVKARREPPRAAVGQPKRTSEPHIPPKTVQRATTASSAPIWPESKEAAAEIFGMGSGPEDIDYEVDSFDNDDEDMLAKAAAVLADEDIDPQAQSETKMFEEDDAPAFLNGQKVVEAATGTKGTIMLLDESTGDARVEWEDGMIADISTMEIIPLS